jgi:hypothetical protein
MAVYQLKIKKSVYCTILYMDSLGVQIHFYIITNFIQTSAGPSWGFQSPLKALIRNPGYITAQFHCQWC